MTLYPGTRLRASWTVTDETAEPPALESPTAMTVEYGPKGDDPTVLEYPTDTEIIEDDEGTFHLDIDCPTRGTWAIRVAATEGVIAVDEEEWLIRKSAFTAP